MNEYPPPPQPPASQPPYPVSATPAPPKKRSPLVWILAGVGVLVLLCCGGFTVIGAMNADQEPTAATADAPAAQEDAATGKEAATPNAGKAEDKPPAEPAEPKAPGLNQPARDGKFEFVVNSVDCSKSKVGSDFLEEEAQGVFCQVKVSVKNIGDEAQTFDGSSQKAFDGKGTEYSNDTGAELMANEGAPTFLEEINPGNSVSGLLIFDVPKGTKLVKLELHDSPFSGGVTVTLS